MTLNHSLTMTASHIVRYYLWANLQAYMADTWKPLERTGVAAIPILPAQEQPEAQTSGNPYMIYIYDTNGTSDFFHLQSETLSIRMFSQSPVTIAATGKLCTKLFNRYDDSAYDINMWIVRGLERSDGTPYLPHESFASFAAAYNIRPMWLDEVQNYRIKYTTVSGIQGAQPAESEFGRVDSIVSIDIHFVELDDRLPLALVSDN